MAVLAWYFALGGAARDVLGRGLRFHVLCAATSSGPQGSVVESLAVLTIDRRRTTALFVPVDLSVKLPDGSVGRLGAYAARAGWPEACRALAPLLGVSLARYVVLDVEHLSAFLALFPEVAVSLDDPAKGEVPSPSGTAVRVEVANRTLTPGAMLAYLRETPRETRSERDRRTFEGIVGAARAAERDPTFAVRLRDVLAGTAKSLSETECAALWSRVLHATETATAVLPTREVVRGGAAARLPVVAEAERTIAELVRDEEPLTSAGITVAIFNGNGVRLSASRAAGYLQARGFQVSATADADSFSYAHGEIVVLTDEAKAWMLRDALPGEVEIVSLAEFGDHYEALRNQVPAGTDLILIVGAGMEFAG